MVLQPGNVNCLRFCLKGMSIKNILNTDRFSAKEISHYKQIIKRKAHCHSDAELLFALVLLRHIRHTAGEFVVPGNAVQAGTVPVAEQSAPEPSLQQSSLMTFALTS